MRSFVYAIVLSSWVASTAGAQATQLAVPRREPAPAITSTNATGPRPPGTVRVRVRSDDPHTRLYRTEYVGTTPARRGLGRPLPGVLDVSVPILGEYRLLCEAPCVLDLPVGTYLFGVQEGEGRIRFRRGTVDNYMPITRSGHLRINVPNTGIRRFLGALLMIGSAAGFGLAMQRIDSGAPLIAATVSTGTLFTVGLLALVFPVMPTVEYTDD